jgi:hypothetical protein
MLITELRWRQRRCRCTLCLLLQRWHENIRSHHPDRYPEWHPVVRRPRLLYVDQSRCALELRHSSEPDADIIARGRYLALGPAHCAACHGDPTREADLRRGLDVPFSGGREFDLGALGKVVAPISR